jgi:acyl carrier protein
MSTGDMGTCMDPELRSYLDRRMAVIDVLLRIFIDNLHFAVKPDAIDLDAPMFGTGLGLDSVDALELVVAAESALGISLPEGNLREHLRTPNTFVDLLLACQSRAACQ